MSEEKKTIQDFIKEYNGDIAAALKAYVNYVGFKTKK